MNQNYLDLKSLGFISKTVKLFLDFNENDFKQIDNSIKRIENESSSYLYKSRRQYVSKDKKWLISFSNYLHSKVNELIIVGKYSQALIFAKEFFVSSIREIEMIHVESKEDPGFKEYFLSKGQRNLDVASNKLLLTLFLSKEYSIVQDSIEKFLEKELEKKYIVLLKSNLKNKFIERSFLALFSSKMQIENNFISSKENFIIKTIQTWEAETKKIFLRELCKHRDRKIGLLFESENFPENNILLHEIKSLFYIMYLLHKGLNEEETSQIDLVYFYKYSAYIEKTYEEAKKYFEKSIHILITKKLSLRELNFTKAYMSEYLSFISKNYSDKITLLKKADIYFGNVNSPRSYIVSIQADYYRVLKLLTEDLFKAKMVARQTLYEKFNNSRYECRLVDISNFLKAISMIGEGESSIQSLININTNWSKAVLSLNLLDKLDLKSSKNQKITTLKKEIISLMLNNLPEIKFIGEDSDPIELLGDITENDSCENKGSVSLALDPFLKNHKRNTSSEVVDGLGEAICGMLNTKGGTINVGIIENSHFKKIPNWLEYIEYSNNKIIGIQLEFSDDWDSCSRRIEDIVRVISKEAITWVKIKPIKIGKIIIARILVTEPSDKNYWYKNKYFVRCNTRTQSLEGRELGTYLQGRRSTPS